MITAPTSSVRVLSKPKSFGPAKQSFEINNSSNKEVRVILEHLGSKFFRISDASKKLTIKPGFSARIQVEFYAPEKGCVIALSATYRAIFKVWVLEQDKEANKELVDILNLTATGPGFFPCDSLHCFDQTDSPEQQETGRR
jgi:hypothetical protein